VPFSLPLRVYKSDLFQNNLIKPGGYYGKKRKQH
jgi:hypothetical protein